MELYKDESTESYIKENNLEDDVDFLTKHINDFFPDTEYSLKLMCETEEGEEGEGDILVLTIFTNIDIEKFRDKMHELYNLISKNCSNTFYMLLGIIRRYKN